MEKLSEKHVPFSKEAEQGVLGSLIIDPEAINQVADFLTPEHFYREAHHLIFKAMLQLHYRHEPADFVTLTAELERMGSIGVCGGSGYLADLIDKVPTSSNAEHYAHIVEKKSLFRSLASVGSDIVARAFAEDDTALPFAEESIYRLGNQGSSSASIVSHRQAVTTYLEKLEEMHSRNLRGIVTGVPTGFKFLDKKLGGLRPSDLIILAARPAVGKTSLLLNLADHAVRSGYRVLLFSMEMSRDQLMQRWFAMEAGVDQMKLRDARLSDDEWEQVFDAGLRLTQLPGELFIDDTCGLSSTAMRSKARRHQAEYGLDLIGVDYLQLGKAPNEDGRKYQERRLEVEEVCRNLKYLARELQVPVLSLAQLSRAVEQRANKIPQLSDLREAGGIEADADIVLFMHKDEDIARDASEYDINIIIGKHRNGPEGVIPLRFIACQTRYESVMPMEVVR